MSDQTPEQNSTPEEAPEIETQAPAAPEERKERRNWVPLLLLVGLVIAFVAIAWQWAYSRERLGELRQEMAQRLGDGDSTAREARAEARVAAEGIGDLQVRLARIEAQVSESQGQQAALEALYQSLSRNREEQVLAEVEQSIVVAAQQLQLAGNVEAALTALQGADARLAQLDAGPLLALRKTIRSDMEQLKTAPRADISGMAVKIDLLIARVDDFELAFTGEAEATPLEMPPPGEGHQLLERAVQFGKELWAELKTLIRVERLDTPDPALLSPSQSVFLRENLRLRLLSARLGLLSRDAVSFKSDLQQSMRWLERYFDPRSEAVKSALEELSHLQGIELTSEHVPALGDTLAVLRGLQQRGAPPVALPPEEPATKAAEPKAAGEAAAPAQEAKPAAKAAAEPKADTKPAAAAQEPKAEGKPAEAAKEPEAAQKPATAASEAKGPAKPAVPVTDPKPAAAAQPKPADQPAGH